MISTNQFCMLKCWSTGLFKQTNKQEDITIHDKQSPPKIDSTQYTKGSELKGLISFSAFFQHNISKLFNIDIIFLKFSCIFF